MKVFKYIIWVLLLVVGLFYILPATLLQVPFFQKKISYEVAEYLKNRIDTKVSIQQIEFQPFNKLILKNVYIEDQKGDTLFTAKRIACGFDFLPLFQKKFYFSSAQIYTFQLHLWKESENEPLNIQYIIDAFQNKEQENKNSFIDLSIRTLSLGYGIFSYQVKSKVSNEIKFNPNDILLTDITAKINLHKLDNDNLDAEIKRFSFKEKSGLEVKQLFCNLLKTKEEARMDQLFIELPRSNIHLSDLYADWTNTDPNENILEKAKLNLQIKQTKIILQDISPIVPAFTKFNDPIEMKGLASGTFSNISFSDLIIKQSKDMLLWVNANIRNINSSSFSEIFIDANIKDSYINSNGIYTLSNNLLNTQDSIPRYIKNLGHISMNANISGYLNNLHTDIQINSDIGNIEATLNLGKQEVSFLKGAIISPSLDLRNFLGNPDLGNAVFQIDMDVIHNKADGLKGDIKAIINEIDYKNYKYENINLSGNLTSKSFNGTLNAISPDGQITAEGLVLLDDENSEFNFTAKVSQLLLDKLNLTQKYTDPELSFNVNANFKGNNVENIQGTIAIENILFSTNKGGYTVDHINIISNSSEEEKEWIIESSILNGNIKGDYSLNKIVHSLKNTLSYYIPSVIPSPPVSKISDNHFSFNFSINDTREFSYIFELPVTFYNYANIKGSYNSQNNYLNLNAEFPYIKYNNYRIENGKIELMNNENLLDLKINAVNLQKNNKLTVATEFKIANDSIFSNISWTDNKNGKYKGNVDFKTHLVLAKDNNPLSASVLFQPSELIVNDLLWTISPTNIHYKEERLYIQKFKASHNTQHIMIDGYISKDPQDEILLDLNNVNLDYIFKSLNKKALTFGGIASGYLIAKDVYNTRQLSTHLDVKKFAFNYVELGNLTLNGRWIEDEQGIEMKGNVFNNDSSYVGVDGFIYPVKEEISILFDAKNTNAAFLRKYLNNIAQDLSGELTGKLRLLGNLNDPTVEGNVFVKNGQFGVEFLNTQYSFSDWVSCTPDKISLKNVLFYDKYGNKSLVNGYVKHNLFADFYFDANLTYENFLIFDATHITNPTFYGPVFGTGTASIKGTEDVVNIDVSMHNTANTHLTLNFMDETDIEDYNFINFIRKEEKDTIVEQTPWQWENTVTSKFIRETETDIRLNLLINANNQATVEMIMDTVSGDKISATGAGSMQIQYGTKTPMKVIGTYNIEKGRYNFSFQQALFRNFEIADGSSVTFRGNPYTADLNIKATYTVTANLGDLDQQLLQMSARNNIPVNCVLLLSGPLQQPVISFDIELPNSSAELERQVKSYIRTDEMLNRQIVYLLVLSRFYTSPEYTQGDVRFSNDLSYLTSTLSTQISNMLGGISDNFQVGTKFHQSSEGEETSTEVELLLSSTLLNNRLIINGNFGYIDNPYTHSNNNNVPLVGDFDIEYKLTRNGDIRLKGFNRYNYRNYFSTSPEMTQGVGILFRRDFNNLKDLFSRRRNLQIINLPEENENNNSATDPQTESATEEKQ